MENESVSGLIPLTDLDTKTFERTITLLDRFWKTKSITLLDYLGLPTLEAIAITKWNDEIKQNLLSFCNTKNWTSVVIRTDKEKESGKNIPRGGYLSNLSNLENEVKKHLQNGRIVMVLEPRNKFQNLYGINVVYDNPETLYFEVVGHGFDISNLNRGDINPHESFSVNLHGERLDISNHQIIEQQEYEKSIALRYKQIGESISEENLNLSDEEKIQSGKNFLNKNSYYLLENSKNYVPLPIDEVKKIRNSITKLPYVLGKMGLDNDIFVISSTIFDSGELIFWDIVWPKYKFEGVNHG